MVALPATPTDQACAVADRIRAGLRDASSGAGLGITFTVSVGVATLRSGESLDVLLRRADAAVYVAKRRGRDCVVVGEGEAEGALAPAS